MPNPDPYLPVPVDNNPKNDSSKSNLGARAKARIKKVGGALKSGAKKAGPFAGLIGGLLGGAAVHFWNNGRSAVNYASDKYRSNTGSYNAVIFVAILIHLIKTSILTVGNYSWTIDLIAFFIFWILVPARDKDILLKPMLFVFFIEILQPLFGLYLPMLMDYQFFIFLFSFKALTPWWLIFFIIKSPGETFTEVLFKRLLFGYFFIIFFGFIFTYMGVFPDIGGYNTDEIVAPLSEQGNFFWDKVKIVYDNFKTLFAKAYQGIKQSFIGRMDYATGGYYSGRVDENSNEILGVFIEKFEAGQDFFYKDEIASAIGRVKAKTIDIPIDIKLECLTNDDTVSIPQVYPNRISQVYDLDEEQVLCRYSAHSSYLEKGYNQVTLKASFDFETMAYQKNYFMDMDRLNSLKRQGIDPLDEYSIEDKEPVAIYTNGPVMLGMELSNPLTGISKTDENAKPMLGITIDTNYGWEGNIREIKDVIIEVPDSMSLDLGQCNMDLVEIEEDPMEWCLNDNVEKSSRIYKTCIERFGASPMENNLDYDETDMITASLEKEKIDDACLRESGDGGCRACIEEHCKKETEGYRVYKLLKYNNFDEVRESKSYITITCRVNIDDKKKLLGNTPIAIKNFRARVYYSFEIEKEAVIQIKGVSGIDPTTEYYQYSFSNSKEERQKEILKQYGSIIEDSDGSAFDSCSVASIINAMSNGAIVKRSDVGQIGLMQIYEKDAKNIVDEFKSDDDNTGTKSKYSDCQFSEAVLDKMKSSEVKYYSPELNIALGRCELNTIKDSLSNYDFSTEEEKMLFGRNDVSKNQEPEVDEENDYLLKEIDKYSLAYYMSLEENKIKIKDACLENEKFILFEECLKKTEIKSIIGDLKEIIDSIAKFTETCAKENFVSQFELEKETNTEADSTINGNVDFYYDKFNINEDQEYMITKTEYESGKYLEEGKGIIIKFNGYTESDSDKRASVELITFREYDTNSQRVKPGEKSVICSDIPVHINDDGNYYKCDKFPFIEFYVNKASEEQITVKYKLLNKFVKNTEYISKGKVLCSADKEEENLDIINTEVVPDKLYAYYSSNNEVSFYNNEEGTIAFCRENWDSSVSSTYCDEIPHFSIKSIELKSGESYYKGYCEGQNMNDVGNVKVQLIFDPNSDRGKIQYIYPFEKKVEGADTPVSDSADGTTDPASEIDVTDEEPKKTISLDELDSKGINAAIQYAFDNELNGYEFEYDVNYIGSEFSISQAQFDSVVGKDFCSLSITADYFSPKHANYAKVCFVKNNCCEDKTCITKFECLRKVTAVS